MPPLPSSPDAVSVGLVGCGTISRAYLRAAASFPEYRVVACADLDRDRAAGRAGEFGLAATGVDELLADPHIELVLNLTIPAAHAAVGLRAIEAGKHVYSEKPLGLSVGEAGGMLAEAERRGLRVGCAPDTFLGGAHQSVRALLDAGTIGQVTSGTATMMNHGHEHWHHDPAFYYQPGGGPLFDMGPYYLTALVDLLGPVERVVAMTDRSRGDRVIGTGPKRDQTVPVAVDTHVAGLLRFASGATVSLTTSFDVWSHRHTPIELYGTAGSVLVPDPNRFDGRPMVAVGRGAFEEVAPTHGFDGADHRGVGLADMARAIRLGRPHRADGALAMHVLEVMEKLIEAGAGGRSPAVDSRCERPAALPRRREIGLLD